MSVNKPKRTGAGEAGLPPSDTDPSVPAGGGSLVPQPQGLKGAESALVVGSDHFVPAIEAPITALVARVVYHPVLSPATLLAAVGVSNKAGELFFAEALASELTGNRPAALRLYQRAIEAWGSSFSGDKNKRIAETCERIGALESDPARQSDYVAQAAIHWTLHAKVLLKKGKSREAMDILKKAIAFSQKPGVRLDRTKRNTLHALCLQARAAWLARQNDPESDDDPDRLSEAGHLIEQIIQKSLQGEDPAELVGQAMNLAAEMVPEVIRYAGQSTGGGWEHTWIDFGGMETKLDTAIFIFAAVEEWVTDPDDQRIIVTAYRMRARLHQKMQMGSAVAFDEAKTAELELRWGRASEQSARLIGVVDVVTVSDQSVAVLPATVPSDLDEHSSSFRDLFLQARLLSRWGKQGKANQIYFYLAQQAEERGDLRSALELYRMIYFYTLNRSTAAVVHEKIARLLPDSPERASYFERAATDWWMFGTLEGQRRAVDLIQGPARQATGDESRMAICRDFLRALCAALRKAGKNATADLIQQASWHVEKTQGPWGRVSMLDVMEIGAELVSQTTDAESHDHALWLLDGALALYFGVGGINERQVAATYLLRANLRRSLGLSEFVAQDEKNAGDKELPADDLMRLATLAYTRSQALEPEEERWIPFIGIDGHAPNPAGMGRRAYERRVANILFPSVWDLAESPALFAGIPPMAAINEGELFRRHVGVLEGFGNRYVWSADPLTIIPIVSLPEYGFTRLDQILHDSHCRFGKFHPNLKETLARLLAAHYVHEMGANQAARDFLETHRIYFSKPLPEAGDDQAVLSPEGIYRDIKKANWERNHQGDIFLDSRLDSLPSADPHQPDATVADFIEGILRQETQAQGIPPPVWTLTDLIRLVRQKLSSHSTDWMDISKVSLRSRLVDVGVSDYFEIGGGSSDLFYYLDDLRKSLETAFPVDMNQQNTLEDVILAFAGQLWNSRRQPNDLDSFKARASTLALNFHVRFVSLFSRQIYYV